MKKNIKEVIIIIIGIILIGLIIFNTYISFQYRHEEKIGIAKAEELSKLTNSYNDLINKKLELLNVEVTGDGYRRQIKLDLKNNFDKKINGIVFGYSLEDIFKNNIYVVNPYSDSFSLFITNFQNSIESGNSYRFDINGNFYKGFFDLVDDEKITLKGLEIKDIIFEDGEKYNFKDQKIEVVLKNNN